MLWKMFLETSASTSNNIQKYLRTYAYLREEMDNNSAFFTQGAAWRIGRPLPGRALFN